MSKLQSAQHRDSARRVTSPAADRSSARPWTLLDKLVLALSVLNLIGVVALIVMLCLLSEDWWLSLALSYLPRVPYVVPSVLLVLASLLLRRRFVWLNLLSALLVAGPIMGFRAPVSAWALPLSDQALTIVSYNVQGNSADVHKVFDELIAAEPDIFALQEATLDATPLREHFDDWHFVHTGEYLLAARWPVTMKEACRTRGFGRATAVLYEVDHPDGHFLLANVHLTTARYGLARLRPDSPLTGHGAEALMERQQSRKQETAATRKFIEALDEQTPLLVVGDFNMPVTSSLFQQDWGEFTSAFDAAGWGYGYTAPCNTTGHYWPGNTPWLRIDHILLSPHWDAGRSWIGKTNGSDHRYIAARIARR